MPNSFLIKDILNETKRSSSDATKFQQQTNDYLLQQFYARLLMSHLNTTYQNDELFNEYKQQQKHQLDITTTTSDGENDDSSPISSNRSSISPLDALFQMTNRKEVDLSIDTGSISGGSDDKCDLNKNHNQQENYQQFKQITINTQKEEQTHQQRKRKNRTAFTAHQIYELEKHFSLQRYLSPADRDRISQELSLTTSQVITWFQNRRAKQKRDVDECKSNTINNETDHHDLTNSSFTSNSAQHD